MLGKRRQQLALYDVGALEKVRLTPGTFHAQLAAHASTLFQDQDFDSLYKTGGRPSIPPSQMSLLMILQYHAGVSDEEAVERSAWDARWCAVLGTEIGEPLCARSTLIEFRARLALNDQVEVVFDRVLAHAREQGLLKNRSLKVLLDTRPVVGRGAVEDTYNLLARAMDRLIRAMAAWVGMEPADWAVSHDYADYLRTRDGSFKGKAEIDWSRRSERQKLLSRTATAALRLLRESEPVLEQMGAERRRELDEHVQLLRRIVEQNLKLRETGPDEVAAEIVQGTAKDRVCSATDPEQRHGHKSASKTFNGHKVRVAVDAESGLVLDAEVLPGNAGDADGALDQVQRTAEKLEEKVEYTVGDCAFGSGDTRAEFAAAEQTLYARTPTPTEKGELYPKVLFTVLYEDGQAKTVTCPAGRTATAYVEGRNGKRSFRFGTACRRCVRRYDCVKKVSDPRGREIQIGPKDYERQQRLDFQRSDHGKEIFRSRVTAEHALARLARCGAGQARYFGRKKTRFQMLMIAAVANLRLTMNRKAKPTPRAGSGAESRGTATGTGDPADTTAVSMPTMTATGPIRAAQTQNRPPWWSRIAPMWRHVRKTFAPPWENLRFQEALF